MQSGKGPVGRASGQPLLQRSELTRSMQIVHSADGLGALTGAGVTIGNFDGVHKGHQALIRRTLDVCRQRDLACVLVTFWPHPRLVVSPHKAHAPLTSRKRRLELLAGLGVGIVLFLLLLTAGLIAYKGTSIANGGAGILCACLCGGAIPGLLARKPKKKRRR